MTTPLRILRLDDNETDGELMRRVLVAGGIACEFVPAARGDEFIAAPEGENFDLILSDFPSAGTDAGSAFELAHKAFPEVPCLLVSGFLGDQRVIASGGRGTPDGRLERFVAALCGATDASRDWPPKAPLLPAELMEAVGRLAGGVAHDFGNVLTIIIGWSRLLLDRGTLPPDAIGPLTHIYTAGTRAANLTRQLLVFSGKQPVDCRPLDLNQLVGEVAETLHRSIGELIILKLALSPDACRSEADGGMLEQVLMSLAQNARDAMPNGGTLTIATEHVAIGDDVTRRHPDARPGGFVCLSVRDTGGGIPPENLPRIFEPFFTTKEDGVGVGLDLAMAFGIVQQHAGWIELESAVGTGTCFRILLPAERRAIAAPTEDPATTADRSGTETILLVEDEAAVREFAVAVLRSEGHRVLQAGSGVDALEVWKWHAARIALLVTDLVLPGSLSGVELAARLRAEKPALKIVLTSSYANEMAGGKFRPPAGTHFIHKPYQPEVLTHAVRDALDDNHSR
jgi:two-component system cell cycle sensor histidine kinase/response regulator CckA